MSKALMTVLMLLACWTLAWPASCETEKQGKLLKLHASITESGMTPKMDAVYRFLSEQASNAYSDGDLAKAETLYRQALSASKEASPESRVMLIVNLAAVCRDRRKNQEAEKLFGEAIKTYRASLKGRKPVAAYIADHYSALLAKTGREQDSQMLRLSANSDFEQVNALLKSDTMESTDESSFRSGRTVPLSGGTSFEFPEVEYEITLEPSYSAYNGTMLKNPDFWKFKTAQGPVIIKVASQYRPLEIHCNVPPNTPLMPYAHYATELLKTKGGQLLKETHWAFNLPCEIEKTTIAGKCPYRNTPWVREDISVELPAHGIFETHPKFIERAH